MIKSSSFCLVAENRDKLFLLCKLLLSALNSPILHFLALFFLHVGLIQSILSVFAPLGIPPNSRMEAMQAAILLMPDPNREALQTLLLFLSEVAANSETNQVKLL